MGSDLNKPKLSIGYLDSLESDCKEANEDLNIFRSGSRIPKKVMNDQDVMLNHLRSTNLYVKTLEELKPIKLKCSVENCYKSVSFECKCSFEKILMCKSQLSTHMVNRTSEQHVITSLKSALDSHDRNKLVRYTQEYNSDLKLLKKKIISKFFNHLSKIIRDVSDLSIYFNQIIFENDQIVLNLISDDSKTFEDITIWISI